VEFAIDCSLGDEERETEALNGDIQTTIAQHPRKQNTKQNT
jgi:hypothetical protein